MSRHITVSKPIRINLFQNNPSLIRGIRRSSVTDIIMSDISKILAKIQCFFRMGQSPKKSSQFDLGPTDQDIFGQKQSLSEIVMIGEKQKPLNFKCVFELFFSKS